MYSYFRNSCDDGNGNRFLRVYIGDETVPLPQPLSSDTYYIEEGIHGGKGEAVQDDGTGGCDAAMNEFTPDDFVTGTITGTAPAADGTNARGPSQDHFHGWL